jgi:hypothetical protein
LLKLFPSHCLTIDRHAALVGEKGSRIPGFGDSGFSGIGCHLISNSLKIGFVSLGNLRLPDPLNPVDHTNSLGDDPKIIEQEE